MRCQLHTHHHSSRVALTLRMTPTLSPSAFVCCCAGQPNLHDGHVKAYEGRRKFWRLGRLACRARDCCLARVPRQKRARVCSPGFLLVCSKVHFADHSPLPPPTRAAWPLHTVAPTCGTLHRSPSGPPTAAVRALIDAPHRLVPLSPGESWPSGTPESSKAHALGLGEPAWVPAPCVSVACACRRVRVSSRARAPCSELAWNSSCETRSGGVGGRCISCISCS